jgi:UDP-N-acetylmuramoyl-L-alanyl-D-glutamate--2,6-diaminopimelate ligase
MIGKLFEGIDHEILLFDYQGEYNGIEYNSSKVEEGYVFVALVGNREDGHNYIDYAVRNGAKLIVISKKIKMDYCGINIVKVEDTRKILGKLASNFYGAPEKKLDIIGVTGKTTTSYLVHRFLDESAFIGSVGIEIGDARYPAVNTTPESADIIKFAKEAVDNGMKYLVLEVSSQGIDNWRIENLSFRGAIFTNLTKEHLDYHKNMENYFEVKSKLFDKLIDKNYVGVVNIEDEYGRRIAERYKNIISYGTDKSIYNGRVENMEIDKMEIEISGPKKKYNLETKLIGYYNMNNIIAAIAMVEGLGENTDNIFSILKELRCVEGRMEIVEKNGIKIIIDYAHTEDALEKVLKTIDRCKKRRLLTLISGTGERYREKRPILGKIAGLYSDFVIISSNSPRNEEPLDIALEVASGMEQINYKNYNIEVDRKKAVRKLIEMGEEGDIILLTGKGHEKYQEIKGKKEKYNELDTVNEILKIKNHL